MKVNPLHDGVVLKRAEADTTTASGIIIPDNASEKPDQGIVLAVGPGRRTENGDLVSLTVKINDKVLFGKYAGQAIKIDGEEMVVLREEEIYGIIEE